MADTYTLISSVIVGAGGASTIQFNSIPNTYTDLKIVGSSRSNVSAVLATLYIQFNGNNANYSWIDVYGDGSGTGNNKSTGQGSLGNIFQNGNTSTSNTFTNFEVYIPNYVGSSNKSLSIDTVVENNATAGYPMLYAGLWGNTSAITSITIGDNSGSTLAQYSNFYLYGIKNS